MNWDEIWTSERLRRSGERKRNGSVQPDWEVRKSGMVLGVELDRSDRSRKEVQLTRDPPKAPLLAEGDFPRKNFEAGTLESVFQ
jgi:hypothetical protein